MRYIYPALPLLTIGMALAVSAALGSRLRGAISTSMVAVFALNVYFLASSGWYHKDFFLNLFSRAEVDDYLQQTAPIRKLVDYLNRQGGDPRVAFLTDDEIGDLRGHPYADSWRSYRYYRMLGDSGSARDDLSCAHAFGITWFIAPTRESGLLIGRVPAREFLDEFTTPEYTFGNYYLARLRDDCRLQECAPFITRAPQMPAPTGTYDDPSDRIVWQGPWYRGRFAEASGGTVTYSNRPGSQIILHFTGTAVTWFYTGAANRGSAAVEIDGKSYGKVDQYTPATTWQASRTFDGLVRGDHTLTIRVLGEKSPQSTDCYIDLDRLVVR